MADKNLLKHIRKMRDYERDILVLYINHYFNLKIQKHQLGLVSRKDALKALQLAREDKELGNNYFYWGGLTRLIKSPAWCPRLEAINCLVFVLFLEFLWFLGLFVWRIVS